MAPILLRKGLLVSLATLWIALTRGLNFSSDSAFALLDLG